jgi:hypothetical protein
MKQKFPLYGFAAHFFTDLIALAAELVVSRHGISIPRPARAP